MAVKRGEDEAAVFSWIAWPSKEVRDAGWAKVMADPCTRPDANRKPPFDGKRMIYGGFKTIVDA